MRESGQEPRRLAAQIFVFTARQSCHTPVKDNDMWGAQARAAEYKAFQAAAARRASEEHKLPQKPAPVSLGAFTKNAPLNRNKGAKAWKPLVLEDTPEADIDNSEDNEGTVSIPTLIRSINRDNSASDDSDISLNPRNPRLTASSDSTRSSTAPTAPRAMLRVAQAPSTLINPTPKRIQSNLVLKQAQEDIVRSVHSSPGNSSGIGGYPNPILYPQLTCWYDLHGFPVIVPAPMPTIPVAQPLTVGYPGNVMVPNDISPSKQENKLTSLSHQFAGPSMGFFTSQGNFARAAGSIAIESMSSMPALHFGYNPNGGVYSGGVPVTDPSHHPLTQHVNSDTIIDMDGSFSDSSSFGMPSIVGHNPYPGAAAEPAESPAKVNQATGIAVPRPSPLPVVSSSEDEPYDRKTKMQSFVAAQQALARTGKTVLHNPDLHRVRVTEAASPAGPGSTVTLLEHNPRNQMNIPGSITTVRPPPGFELQCFPRQNSEADNDSKTSPIDGVTLQQMFGVGHEDWLELKPVTKSERMKMSNVMKTFARAQAPDETRGFTKQSNPHGKEELNQWMYRANRDNRPITKTRKLFEEAGQQRLASGPESVNGRGLSQTEIECAAICAVGDIVASLTDEAGLPAAGTEAETLFGKYKPAPEYAIERGRLLLLNGGVTSFFEDNTGGFYSAPSRIARDPRFRPPGKEAAQIKADENWKLRGDLYGRRRI